MSVSFVIISIDLSLKKIHHTVGKTGKVASYYLIDVAFMFQLCHGLNLNRGLLWPTGGQSNTAEFT